MALRIQSLAFLDFMSDEMFAMQETDLKNAALAAAKLSQAHIDVVEEYETRLPEHWI